MGSLHERNPSLWVATTPAPEYGALRGDIAVDVAIVGGGITGLTAALLLAKTGRRVAVIEAGRIVSGATGYTTAKVTSLHGLIYAKIAGKFDDERARLYGEANEAAIEQVARLIEDHQIDCEFERRPAYTYTEMDDRVADVEDEVAVAQRVGLPATLTVDTDLPFPVKAAVRFDHQAQFHPRKYCLALAAAVVEAGGLVLERTRALHVDDGDPCTVETDRGTVRAGHAIVASHLPFVDSGGYFARCAPYRSYAMAVPAEQSTHGMYLSVEEPVRSVRSATDGLTIIGGEGHKTGQDEDPYRHYTALQDWARERFGTGEVVHQWSAQDYSTLDLIPYVGRLTHGSERVFVATGFHKWGMTNGTAAAMMLTDRIAGRDNPWADAFDSSRLEPIASMKDFVGENLNVAKHFVMDRVDSIAAPGADTLSPGEGGVVVVDGKRAACFRDDQGELHAVSATCTHLGCQVSFNQAERTWDCPCHGSRFDVDGHVIEGPAVRDLSPHER